MVTRKLIRNVECEVWRTAEQIKQGKGSREIIKKGTLITCINYYSDLNMWIIHLNDDGIAMLSADYLV